MRSVTVPAVFIAFAVASLPGALAQTPAFDAASIERTPDDAGRASQSLPADFPPIDPNGAPLMTALQEQLGLRLEAARAPGDVMVIDRRRTARGGLGFDTCG